MQGFYALVDAIIDSTEYASTFGEDTVPYERYVTPAGMQLRMNRPSTLGEGIGCKVDKKVTPRFVELGQVKQMRTAPELKFRVNQGVSVQREQTKIFKLIDLSDKVRGGNCCWRCLSADFRAEPFCFYCPGRI